MVRYLTIRLRKNIFLPHCLRFYVFMWNLISWTFKSLSEINPVGFSSFVAWCAWVQDVCLRHKCVCFTFGHPFVCPSVSSYLEGLSCWAYFFFPESLCCHLECFFVLFLLFLACVSALLGVISVGLRVPQQIAGGALLLTDSTFFFSLALWCCFIDFASARLMFSSNSELQ